MRLLEVIVGFSVMGSRVRVKRSDDYSTGSVLRVWPQLLNVIVLALDCLERKKKRVKEKISFLL